MEPDKSILLAQSAFNYIKIMDEDELDLFYSDFPYYHIFQVYKKYKQDIIFLLFSYHIVDTFDNTKFLNDNDLNVLVNCLSNKEICKESLGVISKLLISLDSETCEKLLYKYEILEKLDLISLNVKGNFIINLCCLGYDFIFPYIKTMISSNDESLLSYAIRCCSMLSIFKKEDAILNEILSKIDIFYPNIIDPHVKEDLFNFLSLYDLPTNLIEELLNIMKVENNISIFKSITNIFTVNAKNWKEYVPCNDYCLMVINKTKSQMFAILKPCFISLLKYYDFEHFQNFDMFELLVEFLLIPNLTSECIISISKMLQNSNIEIYRPSFNDLRINLNEMLYSIEDPFVYNIGNEILSSL